MIYLKDMPDYLHQLYTTMCDNNPRDPERESVFSWHDRMYQMAFAEWLKEIERRVRLS